MTKAKSAYTITDAIRLRRRDVPVKADPTGRVFLASWAKMGYDPQESITTAFTRVRAGELRTRLESRYVHGAAVSRFLTYLAIWRHWRDNRDQGIEDAPSSRSFRFRKDAPRSPVALSVQQLGDLLRAIDSARLMDVVRRADWKALVLVLYYTGARVDMVRRATRKQYDPKTGRLTMVVSKGGAPMDWDLPEDCQAAIKASWKFQRRSPRHLYLCREPGSTSVLRRFAKLAGLDGIVKGFHIFRKTSATHIAAKHGIQAAAAHLGHGNTDTTLKYYVDPRFVPVRTYSQSLRSPLITPELGAFGSARPEDPIDDEEVLFDTGEGIGPGSPDV